MRRLIISLLLAAGIGGLIYYSTIPKHPVSPVQPNASKPFSQASPHITALQEKTMKQQVLQKDIELTNTMCKIDCGNHVRQMLQDLDQATPDEMKSYIAKLQADHKHIEYVNWIDNTTSKQHSFGKIPGHLKPEVHSILMDHIKTAKTKIKLQQSYEAVPVLQGNHKYLVMGYAAPHRNIGIVALINQEILNTVNKHQRRNLRLIPYPHDHKFRVKTVDNDTREPKRALTGEDNADTSHYYTNEIVVRFRTAISEAELARIQQDIHCIHVKRAGYAYIFRSRKLDADALTQYFKKYDPIYVEPHFIYMTNEEPATNNRAQSAQEIEPNDTLYHRYQWNLPIIETNKGWKLTKGKKEVIIGVVDTGVDLTHPDLKDQLLPGYNAIEPSEPPTDDVGHGTHVAGIIAAAVNNREGVAGMSWYNKILPVKVLDNSGAGTSYSVAQGVIWAADHGAKVINMSLGNYAEASFLHDAIKYAYDKDIVLVAATGNDNTDQKGYPAAYPEVFAVSATTSGKEKASFSNYGDYVDVVAPGENIASTFMNNQYAALSGTSMASPHVAALAGLIRSVNSKLKNTEVMDIMRKSVIDLGAQGKDPYFGYGQIDVVKALHAADQQQHSLNFLPFDVQQQMDKAIHRMK